MQFYLLPDCKDALPVVCEWYFDEWGQGYEGTLELLTENISNKYLNSREIPLMVLGIEEQEVVGACQIKFREMKMLPEFEHWLGGVYTSPEHRGRGVAKKIITHALSVAKEKGVPTLYLQTEDLLGGLYGRLGWNPVRIVNNRKIDVLVMKREIQ